MRHFNLNLFSQYRTQLMGIAAIMIIICHAPQYGVLMPPVMKKICVYGNLGVDIFLFLSGVGCYYSLNKTWGGKWYKKRLIRIFIPYTIIKLFILCYDLPARDLSLGKWLYQFSTLSFWTHHDADWYIALILPIYLIAPLLYKFLYKNNYRIIICAMLIVLLTLLCSIPIGGYSDISGNILNNMQWAFKRCAGFIMGMTFGPYIKQAKQINLLNIILISISMFIISRLFFKNIFIDWCLVPLVIVLMCYILMNLNQSDMLYKFISWLGLASLESYLANVGVKAAIGDAVSKLGNCFIFKGHYFDYLLVVIIGLIITYFGHKISQKILTEINI